MNYEELMTKMELSELVDSIATSGDEKRLDDMVNCYTDDAEIVVYGLRGNEEFHYSGKDEIRKNYRDLLGDYSTLYHHNGQKKFMIDGDRAEGNVYCQEFLIHTYKSGISNRLIQGVDYCDEFVKENGSWLVKNRKAYVRWIEER